MAEPSQRLADVRRDWVTADHAVKNRVLVSATLSMNATASEEVASRGVMDPIKMLSLHETGSRRRD
jgi:hypothetical protein